MLDRVNVGLIHVGTAVQERLASALRRQEGQTFVEYVLVLTLVGVAVALITQWGLFKGAISDSLQKVIDELKAAGS